MNPVTHFLAGWSVANVGSLDRRERTLVTLAGVAPDADGFGIVAELMTRGSEYPLLWWSDCHHVLGHNLLFGLVVAGTAFALARKRLPVGRHGALVGALAFLSFHLHLLCDLVGGRGPDGCQWPIPYLWPFMRPWELVWSGQWELNAEPNFVVTWLLLAAMFYLAWRRGFSPVGMVSTRADAAFVATLRRRLPPGKTGAAADE